MHVFFFGLVSDTSLLLAWTYEAFVFFLDNDTRHLYNSIIITSFFLLGMQSARELDRPAPLISTGYSVQRVGELTNQAMKQLT